MWFKNGRQSLFHAMEEIGHSLGILLDTISPMPEPLYGRKDSFCAKLDSGC